MEILSQQQYRAFRGGAIPDAEEFAEGTWALPMELPGKFPGGAQSYSFAYVIDDASGGLHIIDPGWDLPGNLRRWEDFFASLGRSFDDAATVTVTHLHRDHLGLAQEFTRRSGAVVVMHEYEAQVVQAATKRYQAGDVLEASRVSRVYAAMTPERLEAFGVPRHRWEELLGVPPAPVFPRPGQRVTDGQELPITGRRISALFTPGHTGGHMCVVDREAGIVFTGDHVLPGINSGIGLGGTSPTTPIADYFESLARIEEFDAFVVAPGHEYRFRGLAGRARALREHHLRRSREVAAAMETADSVWEIASHVTWSDGFANLRNYKLSSALSQVAMHMEYQAAA